MSRALITGITGFVGSHLAECLLENGLEVCGTVRWRSSLDNIIHFKDKIRLVEADMRDAHSLELAVREANPDYVFHLASQSFVPTSWRAPADTMETNVIGTIHILEAIRKSETMPRILIAGSSEEYGMAYPGELPIKESNPLRPLSPYAVSKVAEDMLGIQYHRSYGLRVVVTRAFNHTGPRRGEVFVCSNFAKQIAQIEKGKDPLICVGNLSAKRDFSDVRDVVKAYWLALQKCDDGEVYNICSERARSIEEILNLILSMTNKSVEISQDSSRMRPSDVEILQGDCSKFREQTGWRPNIPFEKTMEDLLDYWRQRA